jgi:hypothetical protein
LDNLHTLVANHVQELSGAEFKVAAYVCHALARQPQLIVKIRALAVATGLSWRQTQSVLRSLAGKGILQVDSRRNRDTRCSLPPGFRAATNPTRSRTSRARTERSDQASPPALSVQSVQTAKIAPIAMVPTQKAATVEADVEAKTGAVEPTPKNRERSSQEEQVQRMVNTLMGSRGDMRSQDFQSLLSAADGMLGRLLSRLQRLVKEEHKFDNFILLCSVVRSLVLIR